MTDLRKVEGPTQDTLQFPVIDLWHNHLREKALLDFVVRHLVLNKFAGYVLVEPNTQKPILTTVDVGNYYLEILAAQRRFRAAYEIETGIVLPASAFFRPVMTIQITEKTTPEMVYAAAMSGIKVAKVYPRNVTTNSEHGVVDYLKIYPALRAAEECGMIIQFHCEHPSSDVEGPSKEPKFILDKLEPIVNEFGGLRISLEHLSTAFGVKWVRDLKQDPQSRPRIVGGLTPQHIVHTCDDVLGYTPQSGYKAHPEIICKPMIKWNPDRDAIQDAATSGESWFIFAPDDAAHTDDNKGPGDCSCGVFNLPVAVPSIIPVFEKRKSIDKLPIFFAAGGLFYGLPRWSEEKVTYVRKEWTVPDRYQVPGTSQSKVTSMLSGRTLGWQLVS